MIRSANLVDAADICEIYNEYVKNTAISFEEELVSLEEMQQRIQKISSEYPYLVCEQDGKVEAFAYANVWKERVAYRYTLEVTIYAGSNTLSIGVGTKLYERLFAELKATEIRSVMAVIALPNEASVALHEKFGFEKASHFKEVGYKHGQWIDVGYWQKML